MVIGGFELSGVVSRELLDGLADGVIVAEPTNRIAYVNAAVAALLGWEPPALIGEPLTSIVPERLRSAHAAGFERFFGGGDPRLVGGGSIRLPALRRDGTEVEIELTLAAPELASGDAIVVATLRDLSDRVALEESAARTNYLEAMRELNDRLADADDQVTMPERALALLDVLGRTFECDTGVLWTPTGHGLAPLAQWARAGDGDPRSAQRSPLAAEVLRTGEAAWLEGPEKSSFAFPITIAGDPVAVVEFVSDCFRAEDHFLLTTASVAGAEVGRFLEREAARAEIESARADLVEMAETLQASLLPPTQPSIPGVDLATRYRSVGGEGIVGGDFIDVFPLPDDAWALVIGDVCGRGPRAAALASLARTTIRAAAIFSSRPSEVLRVLNQVVHAEVHTNEQLAERFLTVAVVVARPAAHGIQLEIAIGGHPPPLRMDASGVVSEVRCSGDLIGSFVEFDAAETTVALGAGEALVLFTDGTIEARGPSGVFGDRALRDLVSAAADQSANALAARIADEVSHHTEGAPSDDFAVVVLRVPG